MPGADQTDSLLRSASWATEKLFKQHSNRFISVLFIAEYADGGRQRIERYCGDAPASVSDVDLLTELARDVALDFAEAKVAVAQFCVAYLATRLIVLRSADPNSSIKPTTARKKGVIIELWGNTEPVGIFREVLRSAGGEAMLGAAEPLEPFSDSPYASVLQLVSEWKAADVKARAAAKGKDESTIGQGERTDLEHHTQRMKLKPGKTDAEVTPKAPVAVRGSSSSSWPPAFLLRQPAPPASASTE